jgi:hypothetical protein
MPLVGSADKPQGIENSKVLLSLCLKYYINSDVLLFYQGGRNSAANAIDCLRHMTMFGVQQVPKSLLDGSWGDQVKNTDERGLTDTVHSVFSLHQHRGLGVHFGKDGSGGCCQRNSDSSSGER